MPDDHATLDHPFKVGDLLYCVDGGALAPSDRSYIVAGRLYVAAWTGSFDGTNRVRVTPLDTSRESSPNDIWFSERFAKVASP